MAKSDLLTRVDATVDEILRLSLEFSHEEWVEARDEAMQEGRHTGQIARMSDIILLARNARW